MYRFNVVLYGLYFLDLQETTVTLCLADVPIQCGIIYELYFPDLQEITGSSAFWTDCTTLTKYFVKAPDIVNIDLYFLRKR